jgi:putative IMPACT (imprinted ancient) family translation regulator
MIILSLLDMILILCHQGVTRLDLYQPKPQNIPMKIIENVVSDRGSKYAVSGGPVTSADEARAFIKTLCRNKKFAKATHNTWAVLLPDGPLKADDGEAGAGNVILRMLEREGGENHVIVVTRWFGGKHLGGDRFRHVAEAVRLYFADA